MKKHIDVFNYLEHICKSMQKGVLLTTKADNFVNTMTIGWGTVGIEWNKLIFVAYVRESRYTKQMLEKNREFSINIPFGEYDPGILGYCGKMTGKTTDKIRDLNLTLVESDYIQVPGIRELPLTLECKVIYEQKQDLTQIPQSILERFYPVMDETGSQDYHIAYYGEIVNAYLIDA